MCVGLPAFSHAQTCLCVVTLTRPLLYHQRVPPGAQRGVCSVEAAVCVEGKAGHQQAPHQRLALPALPVSRHHVSLALQPHARVPRRPHVTHPHAHRQGHPEPCQLCQVCVRQCVMFQLGVFFFILYPCVIIYCSCYYRIELYSDTCKAASMVVPQLSKRNKT